MKNQTPKLSILVPTINSELFIEKTLGRIHSFISSWQKSFEILVFNDASKDNTLSLLYKISNRYNNIQILTSKKNLGQNLAVCLMLKKAKGQYIVTIDDDLSISEKTIYLIYSELQGNNDFIASFRNNAVKGNFIRRFGSFCAEILFKRITKYSAKDFGSGCCGMTRGLLQKVLNHLNTNRPIKIVAMKLACKIKSIEAEVDTSLRKYSNYTVKNRIGLFYFLIKDYVLYLFKK